jgi:hypothetical protein
MSDFSGGKKRSAVRPKTHLRIFALFYKEFIAFVRGEKWLASGLR